MGIRLPRRNGHQLVVRLASDVIGDYANCTPHSNNFAAPVGQLKPNDFGLFDMHGNVAEWCVNTHPEGTAPRAFDPSTAAVIDTGQRVIRGGFFGDFRFTVRSARRATQPADQRWANTGLRPAKTISVGSR